MVALALSRALELSVDLPDQLRVLEPSAGDGAFLRGIGASPMRGRVRGVTAVEIAKSEVARCRQSAESLDIQTEVFCQDFLQWRSGSREKFDLAVGNPPFVRSHFIPESTKSRAKSLFASLGLPPKRVSNLWVSILLGALSSLRDGGAFAFVLPSDCLTGDSARSARDWLAINCDELALDLLPSGSFPEVLQEVVILSGRRRESSGEMKRITICDHGESAKEWEHQIDPGAHTWARYLLHPPSLTALDEALRLGRVKSAGVVAKFDATTVTGANDFFLVSADTVDAFELEPWAVPTVQNLRHAKGLVYSETDHQALRESGERCSLLNFSPDRPNPLDHPKARLYLLSGEEGGLHKRYKTGIRHPWYRIPGVSLGQLMLPKRSDSRPRVVVNDVGAISADTIYRGRMVDTIVSARDFAALFHNSLTLLTAEIEGRSLGGGALDLLPSEIGRLAVPVYPGFGENIGRLDAIGGGDPDDLVAETDQLLVGKRLGLSAEMMDSLSRARIQMRKRRRRRISPK